MRISAKGRKAIEENLREFCKEPKVQEMKKQISHGRVNTFDHSVSVTLLSVWLNDRLRLKADLKVLVTGAFLHDFYLYDWHVPDPAHRLHGYHHADTACQNAIRYFQIGAREQGVIRAHMWPLNLLRVPRSREAAIVCLVDKYCSLREILFHRKER